MVSLGSFQTFRLLPSYSSNSLSRKEVLIIIPEKKTNQMPTRRRPPATTPEARENQMISAAIDLAEKQLLEGTASSQVITHFLKLGSTSAKVEKEILEEQKKHLIAKTESIQSGKRVEELYGKALKAMKTYSGDRGGLEDD